MTLDGKDEEISWNCWFRTLCVGSVAIVLMIFVGIHEAQSSVMLPQLRRNDSFIQITEDEEAWIASLGVIMAPISALIIGPFLDAFGRKRGLQFFYLNICVGYGVMFYAREVYHIYIGRIISGLGTGLFVSSIVYLVEICTAKQREYVFAAESATIPAGVLIMSLVGGYLPWHTASLIFSVAAFLLFIITCFVPESPPWLFKRGKEEAATEVLRTLGRSEAAIQKEIEALKLSCKEDGAKVEFKTFLAPTVWKPFVIMVSFFFLQSASGLFELLYYTVDFVERLGTTYNPLSIAILLSTTRLLSCSSVALFFRTKVGRRFAVAFSSAGMCVALVGAAVYEYLQRDVAPLDRPYHWLPVACLILHTVASVLGLLNLPWLMSGEVYPLKVRGAMTGASHVTGHFFIFISVQLYYVLIDSLQVHGLLLAFAAFSFVAIFFGMCVLPETQNKSLLEIEMGFMPKKERELNMSVQTIATIM